MCLNPSAHGKCETAIYIKCVYINIYLAHCVSLHKLLNAMITVGVYMSSSSKGTCYQPEDDQSYSLKFPKQCVCADCTNKNYF